MKNIEKKDWYLGLDIGTNSVGWCATDTEYNILTKGSKLQCGARLFDDAVDASGRRAKRANRRRMARRKVRIDLLQELFAPIILPIDPNFFIRLNSSHLHCPDDITQNDKKDAKGNPIQEDQYSLFCDTANCGHRCPKGDNGVSLAGTRTKGFCDKVYYGKFPTIYHLKQHLLTNPESDPRLLYLACHHSIKYRGHFLNDRMDVDNIDVNAGFGEILYQINDAYARTMSTEVALFDTTKASQIPAIIQDKTKSIAKQFFDMGALINCPDADNRDKKLYQLLEFAKGGKLRFSKIWDTQEDKKQNKKDKEKTPLQEAESDQLKEWSFASEKYEDDLEYACNNELFDDMQKSVIDALKAMYDSILLSRIMVGHKYVSAAMVEAFERHKADLQLLKTFFKKYCTQEQYEEMFRHNSEFKDKGTVHASYANYVGSNLTSNKKSSSHFVMCISKGKEPMTASHEEFLKYVASVMEGVSEDAKESQEYKQIVQKIGTKIEADGNIKRDEKGKIEFDYSGDLCKIQVTKDNATIPHQLGLYELKNILTKQKNNFAFLAQEDFAHIDAKKPYTVQDKILKLITFRIPYYVGPLNEQNGGDKGFAWIVKNEGQEGQKVLPWNFEKVVNSAESGNQFIRRMTRACTYLASEPVVPKGSLLYQEYMLLQDLNNLKINGDRITQDIKEQLYSGICQKEKSLSKDKIKKWMIERGLITDKDKVGKEDEKDKNFNSALRSKIEFENILEAQFLASPQNCVIAEKIIELHTVFTQDKKPVLERIQKEYGHIFDDRQIKELGKLNFAGWGRFSSKFLTGITAIYKETGETAQTIL
ncbi:MAG: type II CRISPR RNA-guided endonuclease Cas9, partial [Firmicutes bacterium]|nr:type II CRISPR RNA-guided endonuclease Cas9 [Bacillota bacterium]